MKRLGLLGLIAALLLVLGGCATTSTLIKDARGGPGARLDPWENWNRKVFAFNEGLDEKVLKPVATGYAKVVPQFARRSVDNFFANMADAWSAVNNVLQGKPEPALQDLMRVSTNTVFGFLAAGHRQRDGHRPPLRRLRPDAGALGLWRGRVCRVAGARAVLGT